MTSKTLENCLTKRLRPAPPPSTANWNKRVVCIIREFHGSHLNRGLGYWITLRPEQMLDGKHLKDDSYNHPLYTWCFDSEAGETIGQAKKLARHYAKALGVKIVKFDERI